MSRWVYNDTSITPSATEPASASKDVTTTEDDKKTSVTTEEPKVVEKPDHIVQRPTAVLTGETTKEVLTEASSGRRRVGAKIIEMTDSKLVIRDPVFPEDDHVPEVRTDRDTATLIDWVSAAGTMTLVMIWKGPKHAPASDEADKKEADQ